MVTVALFNNHTHTHGKRAVDEESVRRRNLYPTTLSTTTDRYPRIRRGSNS